ncbi:MAG: hypothetical protein L3J12_01340 [Spirochaetales bacterium]|nr:hypothetical protein [Spirochaetales bacterium]
MKKGKFNIVDSLTNNRDTSGFEVYLVEACSGERELLKAEEKVYNYKFETGEHYLHIKNCTGTYQFNVMEHYELKFPALAGNYSVIIQDRGTAPGSKGYPCKIYIYDNFGRNLLAEDNNHLIINLRINQTILSGVPAASISNNSMSLSIDPATYNILSFSRINSQGLWEKSSFQIFSGNQIITVR